MGRQSPYHEDLRAPPLPKHLDHRKLDLHFGVRNTDKHYSPGEVPGEERLFIGDRVADRLDRHIDPVAASELPYGLDWVGVSWN